MANCIAECYGYDSSRTKEDHRLGSNAAKGTAATWRTTAVAYVEKDGSGYILVERRGRTLHKFVFGPENEPDIVRRVDEPEGSPSTAPRVGLDEPEMSVSRNGG